MRKYLYCYTWDCTHEDFILRIFHDEDLSLAYEGYFDIISEDTVVKAITEFDPEPFELEQIEGEI